MASAEHLPGYELPFVGQDAVFPPISVTNSRSATTNSSFWCFETPSIVINVVKSSFDGRDKHQRLNTGHKLSDNDVICGRGKRSLNNLGNIQFRHIVAERADEYRKLKIRAPEKKQRIIEIIDIVRSKGGHFLQRSESSGEWYDIGNEAAAAKVGHALRDAPSRPSSSSEEFLLLSGNENYKTREAAEKKSVCEKSKTKTSSAKAGRRKQPPSVEDADGTCWHPEIPHSSTRKRKKSSS